MFLKVKRYLGICFNEFNEGGLKKLSLRILKKVCPGLFTRLNLHASDLRLKPIELKDLYNQRFPILTPIPSIMDHDNKEVRVNLLVPGFKSKNVFGGVATAFIISSMIATKLKAELRIISTDHPSDIKAFYEIIELYSLEKPHKVSYLDVSARNEGRSNYISNSEKDIFIATIWWTAYLANNLSIKNKFLYLVQEFEPVFYPNGDERLLTIESYSLERSVCFFNTQILQRYFFEQGFIREINEKLSFQPAFPLNISRSPIPLKTEREKFKLFFYSRPGTARNLFYRGIFIIDEAFKRGLLDEKWDVFFCGEDFEKGLSIRNKKVNVLGKMTYLEYFNFITTIDLGLSLMDAPHPSYPPLDLLSAGAVVVSNHYGYKDEMNFSNNLVLCESDLEHMLDGIKSALRIVASPEIRQKNYTDSNYSKSWAGSLDHKLHNLLSELVVDV